MSKTCNSCGNPLNDIQKFCPKCGTKSEVAPSPDIANPYLRKPQVAEPNPAPTAATTNPYMPPQHAATSGLTLEQKASLESDLEAARTSERNARSEAGQLKNQLDEANRNLRTKSDEITLLRLNLSKAEEALNKGISEAATATPAPQVQAVTPKQEASSIAVAPEAESKPAKKKSKVLKTLLTILIVLLVLIGLLVAAFIFKDEILNVMDSWGLQTYQLRGLLRQLY